jgi:hypothetical protein
MSNFDKAFDAGRDAVRKRRNALPLVVCAFMAAFAAFQEYSAHRYLLAALAAVFFLVVMPWLGQAWMKHEE